MKYLKIFESFNDKWEVMTDDEFWQKESEFKLIPFNQEELDKIKSILAPLLEDDAYSMEWAKDANTPNTIIDVKEFNEDIHRLFEIWKMDDEWYFIINWHRHEDEDRYLKCDQWDGFEECLTNCVNEVIL
jgi:hypothetical protein